MNRFLLLIFFLSTQYGDAMASSLWPATPPSQLAEFFRSMQQKDALAIVKPVASETSSVLEVQQVLNGAWPEKAKTFTMAQLDPSSSGGIAWVKRSQSGNESESFGFYSTSDPTQLATYLLGKVDLSQGSPESRISYFASNLEHSFAPIAEDAFFELQETSLEELEQYKMAFNPRMLRQWINSQDVPWSRKDFYLVLLSFHKKYEDKRLIAKFLDDFLAMPKDEKRGPGVFASYGIIGSRYAPPMLTKVLKVCHRKDGDCWGWFEAIGYLYEHANEEQKQVWLNLATKGFAKHERAQEATIGLLARWQNKSFDEQVKKVVANLEVSDELKESVLNYCANVETTVCAPWQGDNNASTPDPVQDEESDLP